MLHDDQRGIDEGTPHNGLVVTKEEKFFGYELELNLAGDEIEWQQWEEVSKNYPISAHMQGTGKSYGFVCLSALKRLNSEKAPNK